MFIYWFLFALFAVPAVLLAHRVGHLRYRILFMLAGLFVILVIGLRYEVGPDWEPYLFIFDFVQRSSLGVIIERGDVGFYMLMWLVARAGYEIWLVNLLCAAIFCIGLLSFARRQPSPWLTVATAIPYLVIVVAMSATRQATAIGFIFLALNAFSQSKLWRAGLWIFVASLFHASSILMLGIAALSYTRNRFQSILLIILLAAPAYYLLSANIETYIERYSTAEIQSSGAAIRVVMNFVPAIIYLFASRRFPDWPHMRVLWRNLAWLAVACVPLLLILPSSTAVDRLALYAVPLQMYVLARLPIAVDPALRRVGAWTFAIVGYLALVQYVFLTYSSHRKAWASYQFYPQAVDGRDHPRIRRR